MAQGWEPPPSSASWWTKPGRNLLLIVLLFALASCGGSDNLVPDVMGQRLDLARSHMEDAGFETEPIGGGAFGVLNESNWTVCAQEPAPGSRGVDKVKLIVERVCDDDLPPKSKVP